MFVIFFRKRFKAVSVQCFKTGVGNLFAIVNPNPKFKKLWVGSNKLFVMYGIVVKNGAKINAMTKKQD